MNFSRLISILFLLTALTACRLEPALYLRETVQAQLSVATRVNLDLMWQVDWQADWSFRWNVETLGPLGYIEPASVRVHTYSLDADSNHKDHAVRNFYGTSAEIPVFVGTYDLLFHNNDSEVLLFDTDVVTDEVHCHTRVISSGLKDSDPVLTSKQKLAGTKVGENALESEPVTLMPDGLFFLYDRGQVISDDLSLYEYIDGRYILRIEGEMHPGTFIYLIQIHLLNNNGRVVGSNGGAALTGMAAGLNLNTAATDSTTVSVPMDVYMDRTENLLGSRVLSFGIPGCVLYDTRSMDEAPANRHFLVLNVSYANGSWKNIRMDVTSNVRELPLGGVIDIELDVNDFPPESGQTGGDGGGFNALIDSWKDEEAGITIIN